MLSGIVSNNIPVYTYQHQLTYDVCQPSLSFPSPSSGPPGSPSSSSTSGYCTPASYCPGEPSQHPEIWLGRGGLRCECPATSATALTNIHSTGGGVSCRPAKLSSRCLRREDLLPSAPPYVFPLPMSAQPANRCYASTPDGRRRRSKWDTAHTSQVSG